ncbi:hypothetical protein N7490_006506 [Penicillium lividum]|nr:hypothetical protein N7490_006506 [Penicillium lividum]
MVFRHITSQGTVQGEKVDTPHAHSNPDFGHIDGERFSDVKNNSTHGEDSLGRTEISGGSWVVNGDVKGRSKPNSSRAHIMKGGAITRGSVLVNGDMNPDTFMKAFGPAEVGS